MLEKLWEKVKVVAVVIVGVFMALAGFLLLSKKSGSKKAQKIVKENKDRVEEFSEETNKLLDDVQKVSQKVEATKQALQTRKTKREKKAKEFFPGE